MISNIIGYLICGVIWNVILDVVSYSTDSKHKLNEYEKIFSIVFWPLTLFIFVYHFTKTYFNGSN